MGLRDWARAQMAGFRAERELHRLDQVIQQRLTTLEQRVNQQVNQGSLPQNEDSRRRYEMDQRADLAYRLPRSWEMDRSNTNTLGARFGRLISGRSGAQRQEEAARREERIHALSIETMDAVNNMVPMAQVDRQLDQRWQQQPDHRQRQAAEVRRQAPQAQRQAPQARPQQPNPVREAQQERGQQMARLRNVREVQRQAAQPQAAPRRQSWFQRQVAGFRLQRDVLRLQQQVIDINQKAEEITRPGVEAVRALRSSNQAVTPAVLAQHSYEATKYKSVNYLAAREHMQDVTQRLSEYLPPDNQLTTQRYSYVSMNLPQKTFESKVEFVPLIPKNLSLGNGVGPLLARLSSGVFRANPNASTPLADPDYHDGILNNNDYLRAQVQVQTDVHEIDDCLNYLGSLEDFEKYQEGMEATKQADIEKNRFNTEATQAQPQAEPEVRQAEAAEAQQPTLTEAELQEELSKLDVMEDGQPQAEQTEPQAEPMQEELSLTQLMEENQIITHTEELTQEVQIEEKTLTKEASIQSK